MTYDLAVIGGGPAGCATAITAARRGANVLVLERGDFPRHKVCGEFVSAESIGLLHTLLSPAIASLIDTAPQISRCRIFLDQRELSATISPAAVSVTRFALDHGLWDSAQQSGVDTRKNCAVKGVEGEGPFRVAAGDESFVARAIVNATGRWSNFTSESVRAVSKQRWIGIKAHFRESAPPNSVDLYFFEGGYCGVQPVRAAHNGSGAIVNACAMVRADVATDIERVLRLNPTLRERSSVWSRLMETVTTAQLIFHEPEPLQNGMLQVGDAATFVDPFIGDGISLALRSGALAAECLKPFFKSQCSLDAAIARYRSEYERRLVPVFRASSRIRGLLKWPAIVRKPVLSLLERTPAVTNMLVRMTR